MIKKRQSLLSAMFTIATMAASYSAYSVPTDIRNGGSINGNDHSVSSQSKSRAEYRYPSVNGNGTYTLRGTMEVMSFPDGSDRISIIQTLNVRSGSSGSAEPASQLGIKRDGGQLRYFIVQGNTDCGTSVRPALGQAHNITMTFKRGENPNYNIDGMNCSKPKSHITRKVGILEDGTHVDYFYGKLGAYVTSSGNGPATIRWTGRNFSEGSSPPPPSGEQSPFQSHSIPGRIQAEDYDYGGSGVAYSDSTSSNSGGKYRSDGVDIQSTSDSGGGHNVGWITNGEWLEYTIGSISSGTYNIRLRIAANGSTGGKSIGVRLGGSNLGTVNFSGTGGWQSWQTKTLNNVSVSGGSNRVLRLNMGGGSFNVNWVEFASSGSAPPPPSGSCHSYSSGRVELNLNSKICVDVGGGLNGKTLQVWDSDTNTSCDFRGTVSSNGSGSLNVNSNYVSTTSMSGTRITFNTSNNCKFVKMRVY